MASIEWLRASSILRGGWLARRGASAEWQIASVASHVASTGWRGAPSEWLSSRGGAAAADERTAFAGTDTMVVVVRVANRTKYQLCYIECGHAPAGRQAVPVLRPSPRAPGGHGRPPPPPPRPRRRDFVSYRDAVSSGDAGSHKGQEEAKSDAISALQVAWWAKTRTKTEVRQSRPDDRPA